MSSVSVENFLKTVYRLQVQEGRDVKPGAIAKELGISPAASTDMAKKLSQKKMIQYQKYKDLKLTPKGRKIALTVMRKHRLWETFLHKIFGLNMHEIHREAELLEHQTSDFLADLMDDYLGNPINDPHGDPIPEQNGNIPKIKNTISLKLAEMDVKYSIHRLMGKNEEFFEICQSNNIAIGERITITKKYPNSALMECVVEGKTVMLNDELTQLIFVCKT